MCNNNFIGYNTPLKITNDRNPILLDAREQQQRLEDQVVHLDETLQIVGIVLEPIHRLKDDQHPSTAIRLGHNIATVGAVEELTIVLNGMTGHPGGMASLELIVVVYGLIGLDCVPARVVQKLGQQGVLGAHS